MQQKRLLSIIITAHHEGGLARRAMNSLTIAAKKLREVDVEYEFWVNIDKGNKETRSFFLNQAKNVEMRICYTDFGDPGLARNSVVSKVGGDYVAFIDADDMVTSNWLLEAIKRAKIERNVIVHPEAELRFNDRQVLMLDIRKDAEEDSWLNILTMFGDNRWCSIALGRREIFLKHPYSRSGGGLGYEDYYFNCSVAEDGIRHVVAPETTAFLFQKEESVTVATHARNDLLPFVRLFSLKNLKRLSKKYGLPKLPKESRFVEVPDFVKSGAKDIRVIEPNIERMLKRIKKHNISKNGTDEDYLIGTTFCKMIAGKRIRNKEKTIAFVGNLVEWNEVRRKFGENLLYVAVDEATNIPERKNMIDFGKYFGWMYPIAQNLALSRLIVQLRPQRIIFGDSELVSDWLRKHKNFIESGRIEVVVWYNE